MTKVITYRGTEPKIVDPTQTVKAVLALFKQQNELLARMISDRTVILAEATSIRFEEPK